MKQKLLFISMLLLTANALGYDVSVINYTAGPGKVTIEYTAGKGVCSTDPKSLRDQERYVFETAGCCPTTITFESTGGPLKGATAVFEPSRTGAGISCKSSRTAFRISGDQIVGEVE